MHERNPYKKALDFVKLSENFPALRPYIIQFASDSFGIDFKNAAAQRRLTEALLFCDFGIKLNLPDDRLCPPVPNRLNYVLWVQDIIRATSDTPKIALGIDVGIGASAIYPLLACRLEPEWKFVGTEIDDVSYASAVSNIANNNLSDRIQVLKTNPDDHLLAPLSRYPDSRYDFTICNPPFYSSHEEIADSLEAKLDGPNAVCTGAETEMITAGGECHFVRRIVEESVLFRDRCRSNWYTSMLGKLSSVIDIIKTLRENRIDNYGITELVQGQTRRWAIAWSFGDVRLPDNLARYSSDSIQNYMPLPNTLLQPFTNARSGEALKSGLGSVLSTLEGVTFLLDGDDTYKVTAMRNTWSRAARRKKLQHANSSDPSSTAETPSTTDTTPQMQCAIRLLSRMSQTPPEKGFASNLSAVVESSVKEQGVRYLQCTWTRGSDRALFESFWSHICRKVSDAVGVEPS